MQQWTRIKEDDAESDLSMALAIDAELFRLDSVVRWLDAAEARVNRAATEGRLPGRTRRATETRHERRCHGTGGK